MLWSGKWACGPSYSISFHLRSSTQLKVAMQSKDRAKYFTLASSFCRWISHHFVLTYTLIETFYVSTGPKTTKNIFCFKDLIMRDVTAPHSQDLRAPIPSASIAIVTTGNTIRKNKQTNAFRAGHGIHAVSSALAHLDSH